MLRIATSLTIAFLLISGCLGCRSEIEKEATNTAMQELGKYVVKCGDKWCIYQNERHVFGGSSDVYYQFTKATIAVQDTTNEADRLNGIEWKGIVGYSLGGSCRTSYGNRWGEWKNEKTLQVRAAVTERKEKQWRVIIQSNDSFDTALELSCSDIQGTKENEAIIKASEEAEAKKKEDIVKIESKREENEVRQASFIVSKDGLVTDSQIGLIWAPAPNNDIDWNQANEYVSNLTLGGYTDWRLPSREELRELYRPSKVLHVTGKWVWSSEEGDSSSAWAFNFTDGHEYRFPRSSSANTRILAVRFQK